MCHFTPAVAPSPDAVRAQLDRLAQSPLFSGSVRLVALLRHLVDETLADGGSSLKEATIGNAVYGRNPPYDPQIDSSVRVEAGRIRRKLKEYYASEGDADPVLISLPPGGYRPTFNIAARTPMTAAVSENSPSSTKPWTGSTMIVLPIQSCSDNDADRFFAENLTEDLTVAMERVPDLRVASRHVLPVDKDKSFSPTGLAEKLGVDALLQGRVRQSSDVLDVVIEVSDHRGFILWAERFEAPLPEQQALRKHICTTLRSRVRFGNNPGPEALEALAQVLRARQLLDEQTPNAVRAALKLFLQVSRSSPDYARGHAGVADAYCDLFRLGLVSQTTALGAAKPAALRALQIDPQSIEAHTALATVSSWLEWDRMTAEVNFERAMELGNDARTARLYAAHLALLDRHEESAKLFEIARTIEPLSAHQRITETTSHFQARRFRALMQTDDASDLQTQNAESLFYRALAHALSHDTSWVYRCIPHIAQAASTRADLLFARAELEAWIGEPRRGLSLLHDGGRDATHFAYATLAAALDDEERCHGELEAAVNRRELSTYWLGTDARFDRIRQSPRFIRLMERIASSQVERRCCSHLLRHGLCPHGIASGSSCSPASQLVAVACVTQPPIR